MKTPRTLAQHPDVVLAIGVQGDKRKFGVPGSEASASGKVPCVRPWMILNERLLSYQNCLGKKSEDERTSRETQAEKSQLLSLGTSRRSSMGWGLSMKALVSEL